MLYRLIALYRQLQAGIIVVSHFRVEPQFSEFLDHGVQTRLIGMTRNMTKPSHMGGILSPINFSKHKYQFPQPTRVVHVTCQWDTFAKSVSLAEWRTVYKRLSHVRPPFLGWVTCAYLRLFSLDKGSPTVQHSIQHYQQANQGELQGKTFLNGNYRLGTNNTWSSSNPEPTSTKGSIIWP